MGKMEQGVGWREEKVGKSVGLLSRTEHELSWVDLR